jgi:hypothetical protein
MKHNTAATLSIALASIAFGISPPPQGSPFCKEGVYFITVIYATLVFFGNAPESDISGKQESVIQNSAHQ